MSVYQKPRIDLTGQRFGMWTVLKYSVSEKRNNSVKKGGPYRIGQWECRCDCGTVRLVYSQNLRKGESRSCGCQRLKHGDSHGKRFVDGVRVTKISPEYAAYMRAKGRCNNPRNAAFHHYGGRGIQFRFVSYAEFLNELGRRPSSRHSLDRIDNEGHYEKGNVRWATAKVQCNNRRPHIFRKYVKCPHCNRRVYGVSPTAKGGRIGRTSRG